MSGNKQKETIQRTSQLLVSGWKMLALCCPICNTALMESRVGEKQCPSCNLPVVTEKEQAMKGPVAVVDEEKVTPDVKPVRESYDDMRARYDNENKKKNQTSNLIGQKLLQGWTMLELSCPEVNCGGTPLMREAVETPSWCASCDKFYHVSHGIVVPVSQEKSLQHTEDEVAEKVVVKTDQTIPDWDDKPILNFASKQKENDSSWKISQKLLQGWAMLEKACNTGKCKADAPLLRDQSGKIYCVDCGYLDDGSKAQQKYVKEAVESDSDDDMEDLEASLLMDSLVQKSFAGPDPQRTKATPSNAKQAVSSTNLSSLKATEELILQKLVVSAESLKKESDIGKCGDLADLICKLAAAAKAVKSI